MTNLNFSPFRQITTKKKTLNFLPTEAYQRREVKDIHWKTVFAISFLIIAIIFHIWFWIELGTGGGDKDTLTGRIPKLDNGDYERSDHGQMMTVPLYFALIFSGISGIAMLLILCSVIFSLVLFQLSKSEYISVVVRRHFSLWTSGSSLLLALICIIAANEWLKHWSTHICPLDHVKVGNQFMSLDNTGNGTLVWSCDYTPWYEGRDEVFVGDSQVETFYHLNYLKL